MSETSRSSALDGGSDDAARIKPSGQPPAVERPTLPLADAVADRRKTLQQLFGFDDDAPPSIPISAGCGVQRIRPPVKAHGGKYYLAPKIAPILLSAPRRVTEYLEPCAYGASVFLALPRFEREILGDINPDVVALWRVLADERDSSELRERLAFTPYAESVFEAAKHDAPVSAIAQAIRTIIVCRFSRGGLGKDFAWSKRLRGGQPGDENAWKTFREEELPRIIARARGIEVTGDPCWWTVWESRDRMHRLIYADPVYMQKTRTAKAAYGPYEMTRLHHFWLVAALRAHSGPAAISGYRCPDYDHWLHDWQRIDFDMPNNSGQGRKKQRRIESLWINW
jgi:DNA adenine methylase